LELDSWLEKKLKRILCPLPQLMKEYARSDKGKFHNITLINVHASTKVKIEEKGTFYDDFQRT
jgi:hypothetical protein